MGYRVQGEGTVVAQLAPFVRHQRMVYRPPRFSLKRSILLGLLLGIGLFLGRVLLSRLGIPGSIIDWIVPVAGGLVAGAIVFRCAGRREVSSVD